MAVSPIIRPAQAARLLGVSRATIYRWKAANVLAALVPATAALAVFCLTWGRDVSGLESDWMGNAAMAVGALSALACVMLFVLQLRQNAKEEESIPKIVGDIVIELTGNYFGLFADRRCHVVRLIIRINQRASTLLLICQDPINNGFCIARDHSGSHLAARFERLEGKLALIRFPDADAMLGTLLEIELASDIGPVRILKVEAGT